MSKKQPFELGKRVKAFRLERGMTQLQVAGYLGVSRGTIRNLEAGLPYREITGAKIEKLIAAGKKSEAA